jgi:glycosyltransferase involved in cell wall biosynthesis
LERFYGVEVFVKRLSHGLTRVGCDVSIVHGYAEHDYVKETAGMKLYGIRHSLRPIVAGFEFNRRLPKVLRKLARDGEFDIVDCHGAGPAYGFCRLKDKSLKVYHAHDCIASEYACVKRDLGFTSRMVYRILVRQEEEACQFADLVVANSHGTKHGLMEEYGTTENKIKTIYLGIPDDYAQAREPMEARPPMFLHVAPSHVRKGTVFFMRALKTLRDEYGITARGCIVGPCTSQLANMCKQYEIDVVFYERAEDDTLKDLYASCTSLVVPSLRESFCIPVIEAATFGKPCVVTDVGALPELVKNNYNGFVVRPRDANALAEKMYTICTDERLRLNMGARARLVSQDFKISNIALETVRTYSEWLAKRPCNK